MRTQSSKNGFSELEFIALIIGAIAILGVLAHFIIDQNLTVKKLHTLVARDAVRLTVESLLTDREVLLESAKKIDPTDKALENIRTCLLNGTKPSGTKESGKNTVRIRCRSRVKNSIPIYGLSEDGLSVPVAPIAGSPEKPGCLDDTGEATTVASKDSCFAVVWATLSPLCGSNAKTCDSAMAVIIHYTIGFQSPLIRSDPELATLERSVSIILH